MAETRVYGFIPARYGSSRFPGKPLTLIHGRPMFWHVFNRAGHCPLLERVYLATDDDRIRKAAEDLDVPVVMTGSEHRSGTDRILEAAGKVGLSPDSIVVNIQGDEPALEPDMLTELVRPFERPEVKVTTLVHSINGTEAENPDRVKVVWCRDSGRALYFSRSKVPYPGQEDQSFWGHIGLYAFRYETLKTFSGLPPSPLEKRERLEQLRLLEASIPIHIVQTEHHSLGVDRPEDVSVVESILSGE